MSKFEVIITTSAGEGVDVWDLRSGTFLRSWNSSVEGSIRAVDDEHVIVPSQDKGGVQIWSWKSGQQKMKSPLSEKFSAFVVSPDGLYCAGGSASGRLYFWDLLTGQLLKQWDGHYKAVSALAFSADGTFLVTGGHDAMVNAWLLADLLDVDSNEAPSAHAEWADHSLPITSLQCGAGGANGRVISSSMDCTVKLFNIPSRSFVFSFVFPSAILSAALDPSETFLVAGANDGNVYKVHLLPSSAPSSSNPSSASSSSASLASASASDLLASSLGLGTAWLSSLHNHTAAEFEQSAFVGHTKAVTALALSYDGSLMTTTSADGSIKVWDTHSRQMLKTLRKLRKSYDGVVIVQDAAAGAVNVLGTAVEGGKSKAKLTFPMFQKHSRAVLSTHTTSSGELTEHSVVYTRVKRRGQPHTNSNAPRLYRSPLDVYGEERKTGGSLMDQAVVDGLEAQWRQFVGSDDSNDLQAQLSKQAAEIDSLKEEIKQWKDVNNQMYKFCSEAFVRNPNAFTATSLPSFSMPPASSPSSPLAAAPTTATTTSSESKETAADDEDADVEMSSAPAPTPTKAASGTPKSKSRQSVSKKGKKSRKGSQ